MKKISLAAVFGLWCILWSIPVFAGVLSTIDGSACIQPMNDGTGKYMLKSSAFYCLNEDGTKCSTAEIHYFDHYNIDGTVFHGYYYHDEDGMFCAGSPHLVKVQKLAYQADLTQVSAENDTSGRIHPDLEFDGFYLVGNLGKLGGASKVMYFQDETVGDTVFQGYYYFNDKGKMLNEQDIRFVQMNCNGRNFDGFYYFGGKNAALVTEACITEEGYQVDADGYLKDMENSGMDGLKRNLRSMISDYQGNWSIYVNELDSGEELLIQDKQMGSASMIKLFVMAATYENMNKVLECKAERMNLSAEDPKVKEEVDKLLWNMITISDNEAFNELVRLQTKQYTFVYGARYMNLFLKREGYEDTCVLHTLQPSGTQDEGIGEANITSAKDCGRLLEHIYRGTCISPEASGEMLNLLLNQKVNWKLRAGLPTGITCANKSGENSTNQHDAGIVFGEQKDYIICVLSEDYGNENTAFNEISAVSKMTYTFINKWMRVSETQSEKMPKVIYRRKKDTR